VPQTRKFAKSYRLLVIVFGLMAAGVLVKWTVRASSSEAPAWMHALVGVPVPDHDEKTDAVLLYDEATLSVQPNGKIKQFTRRALKILRPGGREYATVVGISNSERKLLGIRGWCIPAQGHDYEVKDKDAIESAVPNVANGELVKDVRAKILKIPQPEPGNIVGYEIETEENLFNLQDSWNFQWGIPVRESHYNLQMPPGWEYKAVWANFAEVKPTGEGSNGWHWTVNNVPGIRYEELMPSWRGVAGEMVVSLLPPGGAKKGFESWADLSSWSFTLANGRADASPEIKQKVAELTAGKATTLSKIQALANFVQRDVRYVAIELGIGGWQPHAAREIFGNHYGDCKDKSTLLSSMLKEIHVDSVLMVVNTYRGAVTAQSPPQKQFNHMILGIRLPDDVQDPALEAVYKDAQRGRVLIFDPTDEITPLGRLHGPLQGNYALFVMPDSGQLVRLPTLPPASSGIHRRGDFTLNVNGALTGNVVDMRYGDPARAQRYLQQGITKKEDQIKPMETLLSHSLGAFQITKASIGNLDLRDQPFQYSYTFVVPSYAKTAGQLMLVRTCLLGEKSRDVLEKKEARKYPVEFEGPQRDSDKFEIAIPEGFEVDELPNPVDIEYSFGSYHSKTESKDKKLIYSRTFEIKELTVPLANMDELKKFYRIIASDERGTAVLKPAAAKVGDAGATSH